MWHLVVTVIGRLIRALAKLRGGGSALPGLVVEKLSPNYLARLLNKLPYGYIAVSGTNGKTTTAKMITELLESAGLRVFSNKTGSNFSRGIISAALNDSNLRGYLCADIAVLELDEAHALQVIARAKPQHTLLLNVLRDQLDRFGELDTTAGFLRQIAQATTATVVVNGTDPLLEKIGSELKNVNVLRFGPASSLAHLFPSDAELHSAQLAPCQTQQVENDPTNSFDVTLTSVGAGQASYLLGAQKHDTKLALNGVYNLLNAAAALALVRAVLADIGTSCSDKQLLQALSRVQPAFGRGEQIMLDGQLLELVLVKNPAGFRLGLASFELDNVAVMIAINDQYADGRDMSWLWDVDFTQLTKIGVHTVTGIRAWDMTLRLEHDNVPVGNTDTNLKYALASFLTETSGKPRRIFCSYTAMLAIREQLGQLAKVEDVWQ